MDKMERNAFIKLDLDDAEDVVTRLNPLLDVGAFDPKTATILTLSVSFFKGYIFADVTHHGTLPAKSVQILYSDKNIIILNGISKPIYDLAKSHPITLDDKNVCDYVRFFFAHVGDMHGRMALINSVDDIDWREEPPPSARKAMGKMIEPAQITKKLPDGGFEVLTSMIFKNALFQATMQVLKTGIVSIINQELLVEDMPVLEGTLGL
jgi:hypothetical protein